MTNTLAYSFEVTKNTRLILKNSFRTNTLAYSSEVSKNTSLIKNSFEIIMKQNVKSCPIFEGGVQNALA